MAILSEFIAPFAKRPLLNLRKLTLLVTYMKLFPQFPQPGQKQALPSIHNVPAAAIKKAIPKSPPQNSVPL
jgi:hypothetical protein